MSKTNILTNNYIFTHENIVNNSSSISVPTDLGLKSPSYESVNHNVHTSARPGPTNSLSPSFHDQATNIPLVQNAHPMITKFKVSIIKPRVFLAHTKPSLVKQDLSQPH